MCCIYQEMYAFAISCAFFELKHEMLWSMVSDPASGPRDEVVESLSWRFLEEIKPTVNYHEFHILHYCQWIELSAVHSADNEHKANRAMATLRKGGWSWHKGHLPVEIMYNCAIPLLIEIDDRDQETIKILKDRDWSKYKGHVWMLYHIMKYTNEAVINYRLKYCDHPNMEYKLALQPGDADPQRRNVWNYILGEYGDDVQHWPGA